ncbi:MAG TPA: ABC transporter permease [Candidatus Acidoferrales bacterium]|nr:ABC transporter permease [Candidatus Acidoferrales bacterium]
MDLYAVRILRSQPLRLALTISGVALCIVLMLFLFATYNGVAKGSVEYIQKNPADLWVLQRNAWNILRGSSLLSAEHGEIIETVSGVESASPILLLLSAVEKDSEVATVFLTGFEPKTGVGGPPQLVDGVSVGNDDEIVLDRAFAAKFNFKIGDQVRIQDHTLKVVGFSTGTNAFVIQYAFVTLRQAQSLVGFPGLVTCYLVRIHKGTQPRSVAAAIRDRLGGVEVYEHEQFLQNNIREMQTGLLPFLYTVAAIGAIVLTAILSLLLSINILERRKDFAILKTLGAPSGFLPRLVMEQAFLIVAAAGILALIVFFPLTSLIEKLAPEITAQSSAGQIAAVLAAAAAISVLSSFISMQRLRRIYPLEAFS